MYILHLANNVEFFIIHIGIVVFLIAGELLATEMPRTCSANPVAEPGLLATRWQAAGCIQGVAIETKVPLLPAQR
ncbi:MAG: hypothetical protein P1U37_15850 [Minwuia sp.]|nr:hypothetical protein [Minwuia sp.]